MNQEEINNLDTVKKFRQLLPFDIVFYNDPECWVEHKYNRYKNPRCSNNVVANDNDNSHFSAEKKYDFPFQDTEGGKKRKKTKGLTKKITKRKTKRKRKRKGKPKGKTRYHKYKH